MKDQDLLDLRAGRVSFPAFARQHDNYVSRLASYFFRRVEWIRCPVDVADLKQIGLAELWEAVGEFEFRCSACPSKYTTDTALALHLSISHAGEDAHARLSILEYVHGRVGRSMDHEVRRHKRRSKHHDERQVHGARGDGNETFSFNAEDCPELATQPDQEAMVDLAMMVERARQELDPVRLNVLMGMAYDVPRSAHGVSVRRVGKIRQEIRDGWMKRLQAG